MRRMRLAVIALFFAPALLAGGSCALGEEEEPGCREDAECAEGFVCRGGACFHITTSLSPPNDPGVKDDAGDGG
jgi:Cys-rich repeat protein